ncbi:MAG: branched-chain amino acid ABC transporter permease [Syntrophorhabdales bacterium]|jgi:branched-chain amino acid transport system permease protein
MRRILVFLALYVVVAAVGGLGLAKLGAEGILRFVSEMLLYFAMGQMWNLVAGYAGLICVGQQMFVGIGAYSLFYASNNLNISPYWLIAVAPVVCAAFAALTASFMFRLRVIFFAIGTWVLSEVVRTLVSRTGQLGSASGIQLVNATLINFDWFEPMIFWISSAIALLTGVGTYLLMKSRVGLGLMSVRDNELAAASVGVDVWRNRLIAFVLSGAGCGLAGAVYYMSTLSVVPIQGFDGNWTVIFMFITIVGGIGTLEGPILGTIIYFALRETFTNVLGVSGSWYLFAVGAVAIVGMLYAPTGLWPMIRQRLGITGLSISHRPPVTSRSVTSEKAATLSFDE